LFCVIFLCLTCLTLPLVIHRGLIPLKEISNAAWQIAESQPIFQSIKDEYKQLSLAINAMAKQQRRRIEALQSERKTLEAVLQYMNDGVIIVDDDGKIKLFNPAAEKIFKVSAERAMQKTLAETVRYHQIIDLWQQQKRTQEEQITFLEIGTPRIFLQGIAISLEQALRAVPC
jgi:two-component system phosphate regulon sensor histidine kinase PhoR